MHYLLRDIEQIIYRLVPVALIALIFIIVIELFVHPSNKTFLLIIDVVDYTIITIFILELAFIWNKTRDVKLFFRNHWIEILAVLPIGFAIKVLGRFYEISALTRSVALGETIVETERIAIGQAILHETEWFPKLSRIFPRLFRVFSKAHRYEHVKSKDN
jgi:hypothetical protein